MPVKLVIRRKLNRQDRTYTPIPAKLILPLNVCKNHEYLYDCDNIPADMRAEALVNGWRVGLNVDTEFREQPAYTTIANQEVRNRQGVTVQMSGVLNAPEMIIVHPDQAVYAASVGKMKALRHPVMRSECAVIDYLQALGVDITLRHCDNAAYVDRLAPAQFDLYAFFALAELCQMFTGQCKEDVKTLVLTSAITQNRRLATRDITRCDDWRLDYCRMPWVATLNGIEYGIRLRWIDVAGLHGVASYKDLLINTGFPVDDKDLMKELGLITKMHEAYFSHPDEFDRYALGDLKIYPALVANNENFRAIYATLGLSQYAKPPYLTIGKTIAAMFEATVLQQFGVVPSQSSEADAPLDEASLSTNFYETPVNDLPESLLKTKASVLHYGCYYGSAAYMRKQATRTSALLAKVFGGRCRVHRITLTHFHGVLCDLDLGGCYGQGLRAQEYPFGRPVLLDFPLDSNINAFPTLRQFLDDRKYFTAENELVPGLWTACISLAPDYRLHIPQTFFPSWFSMNPTKSILQAGIRDTNIKPCDERILDLQEPSLEMMVDSGNTKIFHRHIEDSILTQDGLEWVLYACSAAQRDELLDNLRVVSAAYYKRSDHVKTIAEFRDALQNHDGTNTWYEEVINGKTTTHSTSQECYTWTSINLGKLLVDELLANRALYPKKHPDYPHPLNTLYKLIVNGLFGDMVSPYFAIGNVVVGNNITARARTACWYMEASLNGVQSITDGVQFDVNAVVRTRHKKQRVSAQDIYVLRYEKASLRNTPIVLKPLGGYEHINLLYEGEEKILVCRKGAQEQRFVGKAIDTWLNTAAMRHIQALWSDTRITVLHAKSESIVVDNAGSCQGPVVKRYIPRIGQFEFEMKSVYHSAAFHSSANHLLLGDKEPVTKTRSYNKRVVYYAYALEDHALVPHNYYEHDNPLTMFLKNVLANASAVPRGYPYAYNKLAKIDEYRQRHHAFFQRSILDPGDSYVTCGLFKEFSLSQFTMQSVQQWLALNQEYERSKKCFGQYVECFFLNADGTLDVIRMLLDVQRRIDEGCSSLLKALDPHDHFTRGGGQRKHPQFEALQALHVHLEQMYDGYTSEDVDTSDVYDCIT